MQDCVPALIVQSLLTTSIQRMSVVYSICKHHLFLYFFISLFLDDAHSGFSHRFLARTYHRPCRRSPWKVEMSASRYKNAEDLHVYLSWYHLVQWLFPTRHGQADGQKLCFHKKAAMPSLFTSTTVLCAVADNHITLVNSTTALPAAMFRLDLCCNHFLWGLHWPMDRLFVTDK